MLSTHLMQQWGFSPPITIAFVILAYSLSVFVYALFIDPLRKLPGPLLARFTRLWELSAVLSWDMNKKTMQLHEKYGPVVRLAPGKYSFSEIDAFKIIYAIPKGFPKSKFYSAFGVPGNPSLLTEPSNELHAQKRKRIAHLYSVSTLLSYEPAVDHQTSILTLKFEQFSSEKRIVDLPEFMQLYAFDVIGEITTAEAMGMMTAEKDPIGLVKAIDFMHDYATVMGVVPEWHPFVFALAKMLPMESPTVNLFAYVDGKIAQRRLKSDPANGMDFLSKLLKMETAGSATADDVRIGIGNNIIAGSDTTGISLGNLLYQIYRTPGVVNSLRQELKEKSAAGLASNPVTYKEAQGMPYLQAVIKEALRIHPAVGQQLPRSVPAGGAVIGGSFYPEGTQVGINAWALHYSPEIFGADAKDFRPERWLEQEGKAETFAQFAFGGGSRTCIGKNISLLEISKVLPQLYRRFDIEILEEAQTHASWFVKQAYTARILDQSVSGQAI